MARQSRKTNQWFIAVRGSYLPNSWQAWVLYIPYAAYLIGVLVFIEWQKESLALAVLTLVPNWVSAVIIMTWIAKQTS
jgi:hypothetical protein